MGGPPGAAREGRWGGVSIPSLNDKQIHTPLSIVVALTKPDALPTMSGTQKFILYRALMLKVYVVFTSSRLTLAVVRVDAIGMLVGVGIPCLL